MPPKHQASRDTQFRFQRGTALIRLGLFKWEPFKTRINPHLGLFLRFQISVDHRLRAQKGLNSGTHPNPLDHSTPLRAEGKDGGFRKRFASVTPRPGCHPVAHITLEALHHWGAATTTPGRHARDALGEPRTASPDRQTGDTSPAAQVQYTTRLSRPGPQPQANGMRSLIPGYWADLHFLAAVSALVAG